MLTTEEKGVSESAPSYPFARSGPAVSGVLRDFWTRYSDTLATQVLTAGFGLISGLLLPRLLGPQGRGELAAITVWPITLVFLGTLGIDRAAVFFASKCRGNISPIASACLAIGGAQSLLVVLVGSVVIPIVLRGYPPQAIVLSVLFLLGAPLILANIFQMNLLLGNLETGWYNVCRIASSGLYALGVAALFLKAVPSIPLLLLLQVLGIAVAVGLANRILAARFGPSWRLDASLVKGMLKYGLKTHAGQIANFLNQRLDQLLISLLLPSEELGVYVAAVAFANGLLIIPYGVGAVTLAVGSNSGPAGAHHWAKRSLLLTSMWLVPTGIALWFLSPVVIPLVLGAKFSPSILPCRILIFGSCALGLSAVLGEAARSVNRPEIPSYAEFAGLAVTVGLLAVLLKPYGLVGAAIASSAAYAATLAVNFCYFARNRPKASRLTDTECKYEREPGDI